jgi:hypothetical protein
MKSFVMFLAIATAGASFLFFTAAKKVQNANWALQGLQGSKLVLSQSSGARLYCCRPDRIVGSRNPFVCYPRLICPPDCQQQKAPAARSGGAPPGLVGGG